MVKPGAKTPNKNRKSLPNALANRVATPGAKAGKLNTSLKSPAKNAKATPGKKQNVPEQSPKPISAEVIPTPNKNAKKNKRGSVDGGEASPPKKLKKFQGTGEVDAEGKAGGEGKGKFKRQIGEKKKKRNAVFSTLREKVNQGDKTALKSLETKIKALEGKPELTKTARRKLKLLQKLKRVLSGEEDGKPKSEAKKRRERKQQAKAKGKAAGDEKAVDEENEGEESDSDEEEAEEVKPGQILKTEAGDDDEESDEDAEEEEESDDDAADEEEQVDEEEEEDESDETPEVEKTTRSGRRINVQYTQGGKKKGEEKKKDVKAKNLKLQAMRKQGQLAGSVKETQKRTSRRNKKNKVNGA